MTQLDVRPDGGPAATNPFAVTDPVFLARERYFDRGFFEPVSYTHLTLPTILRV